MLKRLASTAALVAVSFTLTSCATIMSGRQQTVFVETPHAGGAYCTLHDSKKGEWSVNSAPDEVTVQKGNGPMKVVCKKEGYDDGVSVVEEDIVGSTYGNLILGGGVGLIVDAASGAAQKYPDKISVWLKPHQWASDAERITWEKEKAEYDAKIAAAAEVKKKAREQSKGNE